MLVLLSFLGLEGCSTAYRQILTTGRVSYLGVGSFDDYNEMLVGGAIAPGDGTSEIYLVAKESGTECTGASVLTYVPESTFSCAGQKGVFHIECTDGRVVDGNLILESCDTGWGSGLDQSGNKLTFAVSTNRAAAIRLYENESQAASRRPALPAYRPADTRAEIGYSTGTAFYVSSQGHLITNHHVIDGATTIIVQGDDGQLLTAEIIEADPANDVALIKVSTDASPLKLAEPNGVERGDEVFTLGYPLIEFQGQEQKATFGRVNSLKGIADDVRFLQVDVPIQPGNSGGPLLDKRGIVVGIVTETLDQIVVLREAGSLPQNVNYAVKSDYVVPLLRMHGINNTVSEPTVPVSGLPGLIQGAERSVVLVIAR